MFEAAKRHTERVNPHGSRLVSGLCVPRVNDWPASILSIVKPSDGHIDKMCGDWEGRQLSLPFLP